jgi:hypothetical protein
MSSVHFFAGPAVVAKTMHVSRIRRPGKGRHKNNRECDCAPLGSFIFYEKRCP